MARTGLLCPLESAPPRFAGVLIKAARWVRRQSWTRRGRPTPEDGGPDSLPALSRPHLGKRCRCEEAAAGRWAAGRGRRGTGEAGSARARTESPRAGSVPRARGRGGPPGGGAGARSGAGRVKGRGGAGSPGASAPLRLHPHEGGRPRRVGSARRGQGHWSQSRIPRGSGAGPGPSGAQRLLPEVNAGGSQGAAVHPVGSAARVLVGPRLCPACSCLPDPPHSLSASVCFSRLLCVCCVCMMCVMCVWYVWCVCLSCMCVWVCGL